MELQCQRDAILDSHLMEDRSLLSGQTSMGLGDVLTLSVVVAMICCGTIFINSNDSNDCAWNIWPRLLLT
jgi:hypothetical protein